MLLIIDDELSKDMKVLGTLPLEAKLDTTTDIIKGAIEGLMKLFVEATKQHLQDSDFKLSLKMLDLSDSIEDEILHKYQEISSEIRDVLRLKVPPQRSYRGLEWRLDVKLATRSLHHQAEPKFLLRLHTSTPCNSVNSPKNAERPGHLKDTILLEADPPNLKHLTRSLEEALREIGEQAHCRKILRNF